MARFDVYAWPEGDGYLLDCQADLLRHFKTRVVVPMMPVNTVPPSLARLHPIFDIREERYLMATHLMTSVPLRELGPLAGSLAEHDMAIMGAIDMLTSGY